MTALEVSAHMQLPHSDAQSQSCEVWIASSLLAPLHCQSLLLEYTWGPGEDWKCWFLPLFVWENAREYSFCCHNWSKFKRSLVFVSNWFVYAWTQPRFVGIEYVLSTWREWIRVFCYLNQPLFSVSVSLRVDKCPPTFVLRGGWNPAT